MPKNSRIAAVSAEAFVLPNNISGWAGGGDGTGRGFIDSTVSCKECRLNRQQAGQLDFLWWTLMLPSLVRLGTTQITTADNQLIGYNEQISGDLNQCNGVYSCVRSPQLMPDC